MATDSFWGELPWKYRIQIIGAVWMVTSFSAIAIYAGIYGEVTLIPVVVGTALTLLMAFATIVSEKVEYVALNVIGAGVVVGSVIVMVIGALSAVFLFGYFLKTVLWYTIVTPFVSLTEYIMTVPYVASAVVLGVAGLTLAAVLYASWKTSLRVNWSLTVRMIASVFMLVVVLVVFFTAVWRIVEYITGFGLSLVGIGPETGALLTKLLGISLLVALLYLELSEIDTIERREDSITVSSENFPVLHSTTTKVASQLDIPMPTITVSQHSEPEAMTRGYRPGNIHFMLSQGTIDALTDEELEAVVAHELAHVANMDAMVMTVASLPVLLSDGLQSRIIALDDDLSEDDESDTDRDTADDADRGFLDRVSQTVPKSFVRLGRRLFGGARRVVSAVPESVKQVVVPFLLLLGLLVVFILAPIGMVLWCVFALIAVAFLIIATLTEYLSRPAVAVLSRARESAADRTAATVIGSPTALASALRTLDERIAETPSEDLRESSGLSSLSIVPLKPVEAYLFVPSEVDGVKESINTVLTRIARALFATHPPTESRIDVLTTPSEEHDTES